MLKERIYSVDIMRGIVMIIMALDHVRDYFHTYHGDPTNLDVVSPELFMTRWITHFCAPAFVFLAGTSTGLQELAGKSKAELSKFLITRGLWLIFVELTLITYAWLFAFANYGIFQVIGAIGVAMIALGIVIRLPYKAVLGLGLLILFFANLSDGLTNGTNPISGNAGGGTSDWITLLFAPGPILFFGGAYGVFIAYPVLMWCGVMMLGYSFARLYTFEKPVRDRMIFRMGAAALLGFFILRTLNMYGDPSPWEAREGIYAVLSFMNTTKYPPSLIYLLMTMGPILMAMPYLTRIGQKAKDVLMVYGRVPMFYYILHLYLIHAAMFVVAAIMGFNLSDFNFVTFSFAPGWGFSLPVVYAWTALFVVMLYPLCKWYDRVKREKKSWWMSYI